MEGVVPQHAEHAVLEAAELWYSGAYLLETVPTALHVLMRHCEDPEEAIVRAVNDTKTTIPSLALLVQRLALCMDTSNCLIDGQEICWVVPVKTTTVGYLNSLMILFVDFIANET